MNRRASVRIGIGLLVSLAAVASGCIEGGPNPDYGGGLGPGFGSDFGFVIIMILLVYLLVLAGFLALTVWMCVFLYRDAKRTGQDERLWLVLGILFNVLAWATYMVLRPKRQDTR